MPIFIKLFDIKMDDKKKLVSKQVKQYFKNRNEEIRKLLVFYNKNNYHQETYQILV